MLLKPDGGELYVTLARRRMAVVNTWTHEAGDYMVLGIGADAGRFERGWKHSCFSTAGHIIPGHSNRRVRPRHRTVSDSGGASPARCIRSNENLLVVVNQGSGDVAVIRVRTNSLLTMIPVGDGPQNLAVKLF
jgi:YVTN family beta-propeller protein